MSNLRLLIILIQIIKYIIHNIVINKANSKLFDVISSLIPISKLFNTYFYNPVNP